MNFKAIKEAVFASRHEAHKEAKRHGRNVRCGFARSRGTFIATTDKGGQCAPYYSAEGHTWDGSKREITELVAKVTASFPEVTEVWIEGGFDISDRIDFDDYEPYASRWEVCIWKRDGGYVEFAYLS